MVCFWGLVGRLNEFAFPYLFIHFNDQFWEGIFRDLWWAQDSAVIKYSDKMVSLPFITMWNGHLRTSLAGFNPLSFFLWEYQKNEVLIYNPPQNIDVLRQRIIKEFNALRQQPEMIRNVMHGMLKRTALCVEHSP